MWRTFFSLNVWRGVWLITGLILTIDGMFLIITKRVNLSSIIPAVVGGFLLFHAIFWRKIQQYLNKNPWKKSVWQLVWLIFLGWFVSLSIFFHFLNKHIQQSQQIPPVKAILVLGSGFKNGKPTPTLAKRLDKSAEIFQQQPNSLLILTGGLGFQETLTEAEVMSNYLHENYNIPLNKMLLEDKSTSTELNLKNSQPILAKKNIGLHEPILIVSSDFHTLRAKKIAQKLGYQNVTTAGSETPLSIRYNAWLREYFAFVSGWILNEY